MRRSLPVLLVAALCALAGVIVWAVATRTAWGLSLDERTLVGFTGLKRPHVERLAEGVASIVDPVGFAFLALAVVGVAVARGRVRLAVVVVVILVAANVTTQALKHALPIGLHADSGPGPGSWPSGHTTAAMVLALSAVLVAPARWRPLVAAAGGLLVTAVGYSLLVLEYHYPSDIVGGYLVAAFWIALGVAALNTTRSPVTHARAAAVQVRSVVGAAAAAVGLGLVAAAGVALSRPEAALAYADEHTLVVAAAPVLAAAALAVATATAAAVREN
jgi:membrane-associated phospholipid phosphatase